MFEAMTGNNDANKSASQRAYDPNRPDARRLPTIANRLVDIVRAKDPTRPVTLGAAFPELSRHTGFLDRLDLVGYNYKEHLYEADHAPASRTSRSSAARTRTATPTGWHVADNDYIAGQFLWTGIDYLGEAHGWPIHGSRRRPADARGLREAHLPPAPQLVVRRAGRLHRDPPPRRCAHDKNFWSHPRRAHLGRATAGRRSRFSASPMASRRLTCGGEEIPLTRDDENGYWVAVTPPRPAPLVLEARRGGEVVARDELGPRGDAVRIDAAVWQAPADAAAPLRRRRARRSTASSRSSARCATRDGERGARRAARVGRGGRRRRCSASRTATSATTPPTPRAAAHLRRSRHRRSSAPVGGRVCA